MNVLIVYAHPEPKSFDAQMLEHAVELLQDLGYAVQVSDLYAKEFRAVASRGDFVDPADEQFFDLRNEQAHAARNGTFTPDILNEQQLILWADILILQFPLWWYSVPAIMKGWLDRVLAYGFAYGQGRSMIGRRAIIVTTTGGAAQVYTAEMRDALTHLLEPIHRHTLHFCGFEVLPPFAVYGAASATPQQREEYLQQYTNILHSLDRIVPLKFE